MRMPEDESSCMNIIRNTLEGERDDKFERYKM